MLKAVQLMQALADADAMISTDTVCHSRGPSEIGEPLCIMYLCTSSYAYTAFCSVSGNCFPPLIASRCHQETVWSVFSP